VKEPGRGMSIGALSKATGVPTDTLRTWERRYGFPAPERTDTGHRRYSLHTLGRLREAVRALSLGHRPSTVLTADDATLSQMLSALDPAAGAVEAHRPPSTRAPPDTAATVARWLEHVERFEGRALERELSVTASELGGVPFLEYAVAAFLHELGARWARGDLGVRHEHFASERLRDFLVQRWRPLSDAATGPLLVCATPAGEQHVLGLHMAALTLALHNARLVFLGADAPAAEIVRAVRHHGAEAVILSAAPGTEPDGLRREVAALRGELPEGVAIVAGGGGFEGPLPGGHLIKNLFDLIEWLEDES
jgi:DNA-binding transcriptional MerR regulator